ncbi:MAG TPA: ceramidase domain-containing protein [Paracoccaceae bacterium]|nr:ceramidase domain-containing protein [Paracoccaceae bacterium]
MGGWEAVDAYCERLGPGFWAEPVNALTNLAFLVAAVLAAGPARRAGDAGALLLTAILATIGLGSFLFHTLAVRWAALADVLPILAFILVYFHLATRRFFGAPAWAGLVLAASYLPVSAAIAALTRAALGSVNGSEGYFGVFVFILAYAALLGSRAPATGQGLLAGAGLLALSLVARSADEALCPAWPLGTHFLWHLLNAIMLGWMLRVLLAHGRRVARPAAGG